MAGNGDPSEWHVRIDRSYIFNRPGQGADEKADELAAGKSSFQQSVERLLGVRAPETSWRKGAVGERTVGARLDRLPSDRWAVVHDLTIGSRGANLDHLVIGPPGVFTINTKHLSGTVTVYDGAVLQNGHRTDFVPKALREARTVQDRLGAALGRDVRVWSVIVVLGALIEERRRASNLTVLSADEVPIWFLRLPARTIDPGLRFTLERLARSPETWFPPRRRPAPAGRRATPPPGSRGATEPSDGVVVRAWRRYGKARLYVNTRDGETLGYRDLATGDVHSAEPRHRELVTRATADWQRHTR